MQILVKHFGVSYFHRGSLHVALFNKVHLSSAGWATLTTKPSYFCDLTYVMFNIQSPLTSVLDQLMGKILNSLVVLGEVCL